MKIVNLLIDDVWQFYFIVPNDYDKDMLTNPDKNAPSKEFAKYLYDNFNELKEYGLNHIEAAYMDMIDTDDCPKIKYIKHGKD